MQGTRDKDVMNVPGGDLDFLAIGETVIDLIAEEETDDLRDASTFVRYQGGSPANLAANVAKLGGQSALISKIDAGLLELEHIDFDLHSVVNTTMRVFAQEAKSKEVRLNAHIGLDTPYRLIGDPHHLRQVQ